MDRAEGKMRCKKLRVMTTTNHLAVLSEQKWWRFTIYHKGFDSSYDAFPFPSPFLSIQYKFLKRLENMEVTEKDRMVLEVEMEDEDADVTWYRNDAVRKRPRMPLSSLNA